MTTRAEAALRAILADPYGCGFCDSGKLRNPKKDHEPTCGFAMATAALTAAAGVPDQEHIPQKPGQNPDLLPSGNTAAGVGEQNGDLNSVLLGFTNYVMNERVRAYNEGVDATIERCAQEGVEFLRGLVGVWRKKNGRITRFVAADCLEQAIDGYASAIRALKDS